MIPNHTFEEEGSKPLNEDNPLNEKDLREATRTFLRVKKRVELRNFIENNSKTLIDSFSRDAEIKSRSNNHKILAILSILINATEQNKTSKEILTLFSTAQMSQIDYINVHDDPLFTTGFTFIFKCNFGQGYLEIIDFNGQILQLGFKIIYFKNFLSLVPNRDMKIIRDYLKHYYLNERIQIISGIKLNNYANDISQSYISRFSVDGKKVNNFNIMNKKNWTAATIREQL